VVTGLRKLKPEVRERLAAISPGTDFDEVIVLDWRTLRSVDRAYNSMLGGGVAFLLGFFSLLAVYLRAWKVVGELERDTVADRAPWSEQQEVSPPPDA